MPILKYGSFDCFVGIRSRACLDKFVTFQRIKDGLERALISLNYSPPPPPPRRNFHLALKNLVQYFARAEQRLIVNNKLLLPKFQNFKKKLRRRKTTRKRTFPSRAQRLSSSLDGIGWVQGGSQSGASFTLVT